MTRGVLPVRGACVTFGAFDGMHSGHLAVLRALTEHARAANRASLLLSVPAQAPVLTTEDEKAAYAEEAGVDAMLTIAAPDVSAEAFVREILCGEYGAESIVLGEGLSWNGYSFARIADAARACGLEVIRVKTVCADGAPVASARLFHALDAGDPESFARLCGHSYMLLGPVVYGRGLGRTVGMPTANQGILPEKKIPAEGVYASIAKLNGEAFMGLTNIGRRPSVDSEDRITVETNLFSFDRDIYGAQLRLELCFFIRGVRKFDGLQAVRAQVRKDTEQSVARLSAIYESRNMKRPD